jgi:hypothetical protein
MRSNDAQASVYEIEPAPYDSPVPYQNDAATLEKLPGQSVIEVRAVLLLSLRNLSNSM